MSVYVDSLVKWWGGNRWCHMIADTPEELHAMAARLGLKRKWFQGKASTPHYDLRATKRELALQLGAIPLERRAFVEVIHRLREGGKHVG